MRSNRLCSASNSILVVVDVQEKLFPLMQEKELLEGRVGLLMKGATELGVPVVVTEQYVHGLGHTIAPLKDHAPDATFIEKTTFSCCGNDDFVQAIQKLERPRLILCGIEAHICVMQTVLDALDAGYDVVVAEDAVSSRLEHAKELGVARMRQAGATTGTAEGILFEWLERCDRPEFKSLLGLFKESR